MYQSHRWEMCTVIECLYHLYTFYKEGDFIQIAFGQLDSISSQHLKYRILTAWSEREQNSVIALISK